MCVFGAMFSLEWVLLGVIVFFSLSLPFLDIHGVMGFSCFGLVGLSDGFEAEWGGLGIDHEA